MSKSIKVADGIEIPVTTTTVLIAALVGITLLSQVYGFLGQLLRPAEAPVCYASRQLNRPVALRPMPDDPEAETLGGHIPELQREAIEAQAECPPNNCPVPQQKAYTNAVNSYLSYRMAMMAKMERNYGEPGLDFARKTFSSFQDKNIEKGFVARYRSGDFHYNRRIADQREAVEILTDPTRGRRYFEPCPTKRASAAP
jgi:hypothetical protein